MEKTIELQCDIQKIKKLLDNFNNYYQVFKNDLLNYDKVISARLKFIVFQYKILFLN